MNPFWNSSSKPQQASCSSGSSGTKARKLNDSIFELYKPTGTPQMQVLFFHGLQLGDSSDLHLSTWICGDGSCWPQTWLVKTFPGAHILSVSYNGRTRMNSQGALDMYLVGENLTSDLLQEGIGQIIDCPVIMVGHSLGGLVIKQLYCQAHGKLHRSKDGFEKAKVKKFLRNIKGIFYYATPQHGSKLVADMAEIQANPLVKYFQTLNTEAARLNSEFDDIRGSGQYGDISVYGLGEGIKLKLRGFKEEIVVSEASARVENFYTVSGADHYSICKPENETSASFSKLTDLLDKIARAAEEAANNRKEAKAHEDNRFNNRQYLPDSIVGIEVPLQAVLDKVDKATTATLGIVGMGGLGKTTLAKALFNKLGAQFERFEYSCFVFETKNIAGHMQKVKEEVWKLMHRQGKKVGGEENWSSLRGKRLFLVLDDISSDRDLTVLSSIVKETSPESRFVVTSRDHQRVRKLDDVFNVSLLDKSTARQLFVSHAFGEEEEPQKLQSVVDKIVGRCDGLPLSLEVVGKSLYKRGSPEDWKQTERALVNAGDVGDLSENLLTNLMFSYNRLTETEKNVFLDVTTFFSGNRYWTLQDAKAAWRIVYNTEYEKLLWQTLVDLSLVYNVEEDGTIKVHEHLQSLGRKIASNQRGVWEWSAGLQLLQKTNGLDEQTIYSLRLEEEVDMDSEIHISSSSLQRLKDLYYLDVDKMVPRINIGGAQGCDSLSTKVVLLHCDKPQLSQVLLHSTISERVVGLQLKNLTELRVPEEILRFRYSELRFQRSGLVGRDQKSKKLDRTNSGLAECTRWSTTDMELTATAPINRLLHKIGGFSQLEILELWDCPCRSLPGTFGQLLKLRDVYLECPELDNLPETFGQLKALSRLKFIRCSKLQSLPESFGELSSVTHLQFHQCHNLENLPESFGQLKALRKLEAFNCSKLQSLPESFGELSSLNDLAFYGCDDLKNLPESFGQLKALRKLQFRSCFKLQSLPESFGELSSLNDLGFDNCVDLKNLPESFGELSSLNDLGFYECVNLENLPESFGQLKALRKLQFDNCSKLQSLPESFGELSSLKDLGFDKCVNMENLPESFGQLKALRMLPFNNCSKLQSLPESFGELSSLNDLGFFDCVNLENLPESFGQLNALRKLQFVNCSKLQSLPKSFGELSSLNNLGFYYCVNMENLPEWFGQLKALRGLYFRDCSKLQSLPESFGELSSLNDLGFDECVNMENLPESFGQLKALRKLQFKNCRKLQSLPESFGELSSLDDLGFDECVNMENLPESFGQLKALRKLQFKNCSKLQSLPEAFGELSSLNDLGFDECVNMENLPESFGQLKALRKLQFKNCRKLQSLPESFGELSSLDDLGFDECVNMENLPESFGQLKALRKLQFKNCSKLQSLPEAFGELSSLNDLGFDECVNMENLPESFGQLKALRMLQFKNCSKLQSLPESFGELSSLNDLGFDECVNMENLPESFGQLKALRELYFRDCRKVHSLPESFGELSSLNDLRFFDCVNLENLPKSFGQLKAVRKLEFVNCSKLQSLPESFGELSSLNYLAFHECANLENLPESFGQLKALRELELYNCRKFGGRVLR